MVNKYNNPHWNRLFKREKTRYRTSQERAEDAENIVFLGAKDILNKAGYPAQIIEKKLIPKFKIRYSNLKRQSLTIGCNGDIVSLAIIQEMLSENLEEIRTKQKKELLQSIDKTNFEDIAQLETERKEIETKIEFLKVSYKNVFEKGLSKLRRIYLKTGRKDILPDIRKIDKSFVLAYRNIEGFTDLFKEDKRIVNSDCILKKSEERKKSLDSHCSDLMPKAILRAAIVLYLLNLKKPKPTLIVACCYSIAKKNNLDGFWIKPKSKTKWKNFFKVDIKTFDNRLREIKSLLPLLDRLHKNLIFYFK